MSKLRRPRSTPDLSVCSHLGLAAKSPTDLCSRRIIKLLKRHATGLSTILVYSEKMSMLWNKKRAAYFAGAVAATYLVVVVGTHAYVHFFLLPKFAEDNAKLARIEPRILADLKLLSEHPVFEELPRSKNAERFLTGFIEWTGAGVPKTLEYDRLVDVMAHHSDVTKTEENWNSLLDDEALEELDLGWVDQLIAYDYFDMQSHPSFTDALERIPKLPRHSTRRNSLSTSVSELF